MLQIENSSSLPTTQNLNVESIRAIIRPRELERELPKSQRAHQTVVNGRDTIRRILRRDDNRLLVVIGPCSVHDPEAALEYARRLADLRREVEDRLFVVMRVYFEKPRTIVGWKGLINDPHLDGTFDVSEGLRRARKLLLDVNELGLPCGTELLDPIVPQYIDDLVSWAAIGARTTESQTHRQMASGLSMPVGYKNSTDGNMQVAIDAFRSARHPHAFLGIDDGGAVCIVQTRGNADGHIILRGGAGRSNYDPSTVREAAEMLGRHQLPQVLMVDCSHANSGKKHENQAGVWRSVVEQVRSAGESAIVGVMIESFLVEGRQDVSEGRPLVYGQSITDACVGWEITRAMLLEAR